MTPKELIRFLAKIGGQPIDGCWLWLACQRGRGRHRYGCFWAGGKRDGAHRVAFEHWKHPIPAGHEIDHLCRNPLCVNPAHLEAVPHTINVRRGAVTIASGFHDERVFSPEGRARHHANNTSPEHIAHCRAISAARTPASFAAQAAALRGRPLAPDHPMRQRGRRLSPETRAKMSAVRTGRVCSEEAKQKIRAARLAYWARKRGEAA